MNVLLESLKSARRKYPDIDPDLFKRFVNADRSGTYKFVEKMCELYSAGYGHLAVISKMKAYQNIEMLLDDKDITNKTYDDIVADIEDGMLRKLNTNKARRERDKKRGLVYTDGALSIWRIGNFADAVSNGKGTRWCTAIDKDKFDFYSSMYSIYVISGLSDRFDRLCYLNGGVEDMFVDRNNRHYFEGDDEYSEIVTTLGTELMEMMP